MKGFESWRETELTGVGIKIPSVHAMWEGFNRKPLTKEAKINKTRRWQVKNVSEVDTIKCNSISFNKFLRSMGYW